jgi:NADPH-dependent 2,4-dienoyl-CoA reductase/sulfur reductase-like enzyme
MAAGAAVQGIRSRDKSGTIGIIATEGNPPYKRPPLSKGLWKGDAAESIWIGNVKEQATLHTNRTVTSIVKAKKQVVDDQGTTYGYDKLLLATGGTVRTLPYSVEGIIYFRTFDDYRLLRTRTEKGKRTLVIGGGFIGSEVAAALAMNGQQVDMVFPEASIGARVYPARLSGFLNEYYTSKGVTVHAKETVANIEKSRDGYTIRLSGGTELNADTVIAGIGIQPNVELPKAAGLKTGSGVEVNELLQTSDADIYAAGDIAEFYNPALGKRTRVEHEDNANTMGEMAGKNMAGAAEKYHHLPFFYSDLFDLGYEAVGELDSRLNIVEDWKEEFREGVIYYHDQQRVRGVLLWNTWGQVDNARELIATPNVDVASLKGRLP